MSETKLWDALDLLRRDGWCKDVAETGDGRRCLLGAGVAAGYSTDDCFALHAVAKEQYPERLRLRTDLSPAAAFNDHPDTTFADVERVIEKAAIRRLEQAP